MYQHELYAEFFCEKSCRICPSGPCNSERFWNFFSVSKRCSLLSGYPDALHYMSFREFLGIVRSTLKREDELRREKNQTL